MIDAEALIRQQFFDTGVAISPRGAYAVWVASNVYTELVERVLPIGQWWDTYSAIMPLLVVAAADPGAHHEDEDAARIALVTRSLLEEQGMDIGHAGRDTQCLTIGASAIVNYLAEYPPATRAQGDASVIRALHEFSAAAKQLASE